MNKKLVVGVVGALVVLGAGTVYLITSRGSSTTPSTTNTSQTVQVVPVTANPIHNTSTQPGLSISNAMVENNTDPATGNAVADRLQFSIKNSSSQTMTNLEVYYTMTDATTNKSESYYQKLTGISLAPGQSTYVFFDNGSGVGHYPENKYSIYRTSTNAVNFTIEVSAPGFQPATAQAHKSPGAGDAKD